MKEVRDLAGGEPVALRLLQLAAVFNDPPSMADTYTAVEDALIAVGRRGQTKAYGDFYALAEQVARWHELDQEPQRQGIDHDLYSADTEVLYALFELIHSVRPCDTALHAAATETVGGLHPTRPGWPTCGCSAAVTLPSLQETSS